MTHTSTQQPEALRIADLLEQCSLNSLLSPFMEVANELRSQHARIAELEAQLSATPAAQEGWCDGCSPDNCCGCGPAENWRRLALQFDNHRMQAIGHLKAVTNPAACFDKYKAAKAFLNAPPPGGEEVLAQRIAALAAQTKQGNSHD